MVKDIKHDETSLEPLELEMLIADKEYLLKRLNKRVKFWNRVFLLGIVVFVLVVLYTVFINLRTGIEHEPEPVQVVSQSTATPPKQTVSDISLVYDLQVPEIDFGMVKKTTTGAVIKALGKDESFWYGGVTYNKSGYGYVFTRKTKKRVKLPRGVSLVSLDSLESLIGKQHRVYKIKEGLQNYKLVYGFPGDNEVYKVCDGNGVAKRSYYNKTLLKNCGSKTVSVTPIRLDIKLWTKVSEKEIASKIKQVLESYNYQVNCKDSGSSDIIARDVIKTIRSSVNDKMDIKSNHYKCKYYEEVKYKNGVYTGIKDGKTETPSSVIRLKCTILERSFNTLSVAASKDWY